MARISWVGQELRKIRLWVEFIQSTQKILNFTQHGIHCAYSNANGRRLVSFSMARNMVISSTIFPHKKIHKQTYVSQDE